MNDLSMHIMRRYVEGHDLNAGKTVIDIGSYDVNGTYRGLFRESKYIGADMRTGPNVDVIVGSREWDTIPPVDAVISGSTFEHVEDEATLLGQIYRILKPGGILIIQAPSCGPPHDYPSWYRNYSIESMSKIMTDAGFTILSQEINLQDDEFHFCTCVGRKA